MQYLVDLLASVDPLLSHQAYMESREKQREGEDTVLHIYLLPVKISVGSKYLQCVFAFTLCVHTRIRTRARARMYVLIFVQGM